MLLPLTFGLDPLSSLVMLAGIYYGAQYGGSTTSILMNIPGEAGSIVTCIDGHQMAKQGRAGAALGIAALGSFFAGCVGTVFIAAFGPPLAAIAQQFNSPDYFSLMVLGLVTAVILAHGSVIKAVGMVLVGLLLGLVGMAGDADFLRGRGGEHNLAVLRRFMAGVTLPSGKRHMGELRHQMLLRGLMSVMACEAVGAAKGLRLIGFDEIAERNLMFQRNIRQRIPLLHHVCLRTPTARKHKQHEHKYARQKQFF
jgi:hypothetical protein